MKFGALFVGAIVVFVTVLGGCASGTGGVMRIDGSSKTATSNSLKQMSESLPNYDRCLLQAAILRIQLGDAGSSKVGNTNQNENTDPLGFMIRGMTFQQILELSQRYPDKAGNSCKP